MFKKWIILGCVAGSITGGVVAQEPVSIPPALKSARAAYRSESQDALAPVQKRYRTRLEALQKELTRKGDRKGAAAVKAELVSLSRGPAEVSSSVAGTWLVRYDGGITRTYTIQDDGTVLFGEDNRVGRIVREGDDWLLDFNDGKLERLTVKSAIRVEHFNPKELYLTGGKPERTGVAEKK